MFLLCIIKLESKKILTFKKNKMKIKVKYNCSKFIFVILKPDVLAPSLI